MARNRPRVDVLERSRLRLQFGFVFKKNVQYIINIIRIEHTIKDENTKQMRRMYKMMTILARFPIIGAVPLSITIHYRCEQ